MLSQQDVALRFTGDLLVHSLSRRHAWLEVVGDCEDKGMRVSVPMTDLPDRTTEGDVLTATLVSESVEWCDWQIESIEDNRKI